MDFASLTSLGRGAGLGGGALATVFGRRPMLRITRVLGLIVVASLVSGLLSPVPAFAQPGASPSAQPAPTPSSAPTITPTPSAESLESWRKSMVATPRPTKGCFTATYPDTKWQEVPCAGPAKRLYQPNGGLRPFNVGDGYNDVSAQVTGHVSMATGSFDPGTAVTSEQEVPGPIPNAYSLQLNTKPFTTKTCGTVPGCKGFEQFIFSNYYEKKVFIEYWLDNYSPCPSGWTTNSPDCIINSSMSMPVPPQLASTLGTETLTGVAGSGGDSVFLSIGTTMYMATGDNYFPDLANNWQAAEFNVFGDGSGSEAQFGTGTTIVVRTSVDSGTTSAPSCLAKSWTGETNNLSFGTAPVAPTPGAFPAIVFTESIAGGAPSACASATSIGDTHLTTFDGLHYDFQASGDFVLAEAGSDFIVQTRQESGAPTWPLASVNKAVATQMGKTRVAIYIEPTRLAIDGQSNDLADGKTLSLPTGVRVSRQGDTYVITSQSGDTVQAVLNSTWINVTVGLGQTPQTQARGLLGNPNGNANAVSTANGTILMIPVSFTDLYHSYADSWLVQPNASLFTNPTTITPGIPAKTFYASDLDPQTYARVLAICTAAGVTTPALLDDCTLDTAVLNDEKAASVFVRTLPIRAVMPHPAL